MAIKITDAPIPGENYTSDTKNYPWHRPPQFTDMNEAFEYIIEQIAEEDVSQAMMTMLEIGVPVSRVTDMIITAGIGGGKFTVDFALLMAGPLSHVICLMARRLDIEIDLGVNKKKKLPTKAFFDALERDQRAGKEDEAGEVGADIAGAMGLGGGAPSAAPQPPAAKPPVGGLAGAPAPSQPTPPAAGPGGLAGAPAPAEPEAPAPEEEAV